MSEEGKSKINIESATISIITTNDIRYEGTMYNVNQVERTITLKDVRSFGTEDRKREGFIAPLNMVYDFIVFHSTEIKELNANKGTLPTQNSDSKEESPDETDHSNKNVKPNDNDHSNSSVSIATQKKDSQVSNAERHKTESGDVPRPVKMQEAPRKEIYNDSIKLLNNSKSFHFDEMIKKLDAIEKDKFVTKEKFQDKKYNNDNFFDGISTSINQSEKKDITEYRSRKVTNETFGDSSKREHNNERSNNYRNNNYRDEHNNHDNHQRGFRGYRGYRGNRGYGYNSNNGGNYQSNNYVNRRDYDNHRYSGNTNRGYENNNHYQQEEREREQTSRFNNNSRVYYPRHEYVRKED